MKFTHLSLSLLQPNAINIIGGAVEWGIRGLNNQGGRKKTEKDKDKDVDQEKTKTLESADRRMLKGELRRACTWRINVGNKKK